MRKRFKIIITASILCVVCMTVALKTIYDIKPLPKPILTAPRTFQKPQITDRYGQFLNVTYQNHWNIYNYVPLHDIPEFMQKAFIIAEDKRFYDHHGVDWLARFNALWQNISGLDTVRGASTITEQVVKMIHPRPRTLWSRGLEGIEAKQLEKHTTKTDILEFYMNQVPYASNRRGVVQAARFYFDRDLETLSKKEMIALAGLVRAPSYLDLKKDSSRISYVIRRLSDRLLTSGMISKKDHHRIQNEKLQLDSPKEPIFAGHFVSFIFDKIAANKIHENQKIRTTLDGDLQNIVQEILDQRLNDLKGVKVFNGAALVVENKSNEILAWTVAGSMSSNVPASAINAVIAPRQPGSSMKPFLYGMALEHGWTAATQIMDSPLVDSVGEGLHEYHNYSRQYYGLVTLRQALGNSLNIPAVRTLKYIGVGNYLEILQRLGLISLSNHPDFYGDGLALGNGEVTLLELVQAYTVFARRGKFLPLSYVINHSMNKRTKKIYSEETASIIGNILSDPEARELEFGRGGLLNFPVQTAVKTGTSSDYRDAWAVGFNYDYTVGIWMGNLDGSKTDGLTGSRGPAIVLRSIFSELNKNSETRPLYLSPTLVKYDIYDNLCNDNNSDCIQRSEWFIQGTEPKKNGIKRRKNEVKLIQPTNGLQLAMDPRIPDKDEAFEFILEGAEAETEIEWEVDSIKYSVKYKEKFLWPLKAGTHTLKATVRKNRKKIFETRKVAFSVKQ